MGRTFTFLLLLIAGILQGQNQQVICAGNTVTLTSDLENTVWFSDSLFTTIAGEGDTFTTPPLFASTSVYSAPKCGLMNFEVEDASTDNSLTIDHVALSGDDRGGIAVTNDHVYVVGDDYTARYNLDLDSSSGVQLPVRDGIFSDLSNGNLYTLWSLTQNTDPSDYPVSFQFDAIISLNPDLTIGSDTIFLSQPINMGQQNGQNGIFSGMGHLVIYSGNTNHFYSINLCNGLVVNRGYLADPELYGSENWADWGVAERWNGTFSVLYRSFYNSNIVRRNLAGFQTEDVAVFSDLSDMASITWSPIKKRWYFHNESTTPIFGGGVETLGYAGAETTSELDASFLDDPTIYTINIPELNIGNDTTICDGTELQILAPSGFNSYTWNGVNGNDTYPVSGSGSVTLEVTDDNNCILTDTINIQSVICTGIADDEMTTEIRMYPNPASDEISISIGSENEKIELTLTDASGRIVFTESWTDNSTPSIKKINISTLTSGIYFIRISAGTNQFTEKLVVQK